MKGRILLVENDVLVAAITRLELEDLGYEVIIANEGTEAIRLSKSRRPDVVLMDFQLDGPFNGAQTAEKILQQYQVPIIFLTGRSDAETIERCLSVQPDDYLQKPCPSRILHQAIQQAIYKDRYEQSLRVKKLSAAETLRQPERSESVREFGLGDDSPFAA